MKKSLNEILAKHSGQSVEKVTRDAERDFFMSAAEAKDYGLVDEVMLQRPKIEAAKDK
jgi:ATP-dependent Clp protease protease subunit